MTVEIDLAATTGAFLIGVFFSVWLFGFTSLQSWLYFQHYPSDPLRLKILVVTIWCLECLHVMFSCHASYWWLVLNYANPSALDDSVWSADSTLAVAGMVILIVHLFFGYRVWTVSGRRARVLPCLIVFFAVASFATDWGVVALSIKARKFSLFRHNIEIVSSMGLVFKVVTDTLVAGSLSYYLNRNKSGISKTDNLVNKLIFWAVNIGILTSAADIVVLAFSEATSNLIFLAIYTIVGNLYSNSLLATLNIREYTRSQVLREDGTSVQLGSMKFSDGIVATMPGSTTVFQSETQVSDSELPPPTFRKNSMGNLKASPLEGP